MSDIKAYLNQIETVDDYLKFKATLSNPGALQTSKPPLGSLNDYYEDPALKQKLALTSKQPAFDLNFNNYENMTKSHFLGDSNFLKENVIPRELKEDKNLNKLSRVVGEIKVFGNEATNESLVENSFLKQLNIKKNLNVKNMFEVEKSNEGGEFEKRTGFQMARTTAELEKGILSEAIKNNAYANRNIMKPVTHFDYTSLTSKYFKPSLSNPIGTASSSSLYNNNRFKIPERPDVKGTYIDNNDIRAYLNSLDNKMTTSSGDAGKSSSQNGSSKTRSVSEHGKRKNKNKNKKMDLSVIEDDMEGEEQENRPFDDRRNKSRRNKKPVLETSESEEVEEEPRIKKGKNNKKRQASRSKYEEDLTKNYSEKELSLYSASHFNQNYKKSRYQNEYSENSLPSKSKSRENEYLQRKYGKSLPKQDKIMEFLDNICEVVCMNCGELVDLNTVDNHSFECFKATSTIPGSEDITTLNRQLKQIGHLLKKKLKDIKEYINKHEDSEHFYFNYTLMIIECLNQIIQNDKNIVSLVSNIKDVNAFNKSLGENHTPLAQFILSITYKIKPLAKLKIPCIDAKMTWEDAKNFREKSIFTQNNTNNHNMQTEKKSQIFRQSLRTNNILPTQTHQTQMRESVVSGNSQIIRNAGNQSHSNISVCEDPGKKEFMQMVIDTKLMLDRNHPGRNIKADEMYNEVKRMRLGKESWKEFVEEKFNEMGNGDV